MSTRAASVALCAVLVAAALAGFGAQASVSTLDASTAAAPAKLPPAAPAGQTVLYGHVASLTRKAGRWELRFDPALWLTGLVAERTAREDGLIGPGEPVPNDYYVVDESHRLLTFAVSPKAQAKILLRNLRTASVPVPELAQLLQGKNPKRRPLFVPARDFRRSFGFWIRVSGGYPSPVLAMIQQYQP